MVHLGRLSLAASGIVLGGVVLGAGLAAFANPMPKMAGEPAWASMLHPQIAVGRDYASYDAPPEDLSPGTPDSYPPAFARSELRWWPADLKLPVYSKDKPLAAIGDDAPQLRQDEDTASFTESDPQIPHYADIEQSAQQAQAAAQDAAAAAQQSQTIQPASGNAKVIYVADQVG